MNTNNTSNTVKTEVEIEIDPYWIEFVTKECDIFATDHCGYWMYGMERDDKLGWLCYLHDEEKSIRQVANHPEYSSIVDAWRAGKALPERWMRLNEETAVKAYVEGFKRGGVDWYENGDACDYDVALQKAMLGEVVYG